MQADLSPHWGGGLGAAWREHSPDAVFPLGSIAPPPLPLLSLHFAAPPAPASSRTRAARTLPPRAPAQPQLFRMAWLGCAGSVPAGAQESVLGQFRKAGWASRPSSSPRLGLHLSRDLQGLRGTAELTCAGLQSLHCASLMQSWWPLLVASGGGLCFPALQGWQEANTTGNTQVSGKSQSLDGCTYPEGPLNPWFKAGLPTPPVDNSQGVTVQNCTLSLCFWEGPLYLTLRTWARSL